MIGEVKRDGKKITSKNYQWIGCEKWWWSYPLIFWIQLEKKSNNPDKQMFQLKIYAEVGPYKNRKELIEAIEDIKDPDISFGKNAKNDGAKYSRFLKYTKSKDKFILPVEDPQDSEELKNKMINLLENLSKANILESVTKALEGYMDNLSKKTD